MAVEAYLAEIMVVMTGSHGAAEVMAMLNGRLPACRVLHHSRRCCG